MTNPDPQPTSALSQPEGSKISFVPSPTSLTFLIPHTGFKGAALVFLILATVWTSITAFIFTVFLVVSLGDHNPMFLLPLIFTATFGLLGLFMFLAALQLAFRKAVILATTDTLIVTQTGPIKKAEFSWTPAQLASIRTDFSGATINDRRLRELQILSTDTTKHSFFNGRSDPELDWLAYTLTTFYNLPNPASQT